MSDHASEQPPKNNVNEQPQEKPTKHGGGVKDVILEAPKKVLHWINPNDSVAVAAPKEDGNTSTAASEERKATLVEEDIKAGRFDNQNPITHAFGNFLREE